MTHIFISKEHLDDIISHSREVYPKEACGILAGKGNTVERVYRMKNIDDSTVTYSFDSGEQFKVMKEIEKDGLRMVAIYHSHTSSPAFPSQTDISRAFYPGTDYENYPDTAYVIVSLAYEEPEINAFLIKKGAIEKIKILSS
jgi:proteasome lid subunit RPN8/RPN11